MKSNSTHTFCVCFLFIHRKSMMWTFAEAATVAAKRSHSLTFNLIPLHVHSWTHRHIYNDNNVCMQPFCLSCWFCQFYISHTQSNVIFVEETVTPSQWYIALQTATCIKNKGVFFQCDGGKESKSLTSEREIEREICCLPFVMVTRELICLCAKNIYYAICSS